MIRQIIRRLSFGTIVLLIILVIGWISLLINYLSGGLFIIMELNMQIILGIIVSVLWTFIAFYDYTTGYMIRDT